MLLEYSTRDQLPFHAISTPMTRIHDTNLVTRWVIKGYLDFDRFPSPVAVLPHDRALDHKKEGRGQEGVVLVLILFSRVRTVHHACPCVRKISGTKAIIYIYI